MKVYTLDVRNVELNKSFYKNLIAMGFNMNGQYGYKIPLTDGFFSEVYWLYFDNNKRYLTYLNELDVVEGYSSDLEGATEYIQGWLDDEEALVEEFNWREKDVHYIDLGQLM